MEKAYGNLLKQYLTQPGSYQASPGYQFTLDQATNSAKRAAAVGGRLGSGGTMAALTKIGAGMASQDYNNTIDRLTRANAGEQQYDLGLGQNANAAESNRLTGIRDANNYELGTNQNNLTGQRDKWNYELGLGQNSNASRLADLTAQRDRWNYELGQGQNDNAAQRNANDFGLGMFSATNSYNLGRESNANSREGNYLSYLLGNDRNSIDAANNQNNYNLGVGRNAVDWYNAGTSRGAAQSGSNLDWTKYNTSINPVRRYY